MIETIKAPKNALKNPSTSNPFMNVLKNQKRNPFITSVNKPNVSSVIGNVNNIKIGLNSKPTTPHKNARISAL